MLSKIFEGIDIPIKETNFKKAPKGSYVVYTDKQDFEGADLKNFICVHNLDIQLYSETEEKLEELRKKISKNMNKIGLEYSILGKTIIDSEQLYLIEFTTSYRTKIKEA